MILQIAKEPGASHSLSFDPEELQRRLDQITLQLIQVEQVIEDTRLPTSRTVKDGENPAHSEGV